MEATQIGKTAAMIVEELFATTADVEAATGWAIKAAGACKGEVCVPLPPEVRADDGRVDLTVLADALGMALVRDDEFGLWSLGPESFSGRVLTTAEAPDLRLPDLDGHEFDLASLRGQKILLVAWAPY